MATTELAKIEERIRALAQAGDGGEDLLIEMLNGPIKLYFDASNFDKAALQTQIEDDLYRMRTQYKQNAKFLTGAFQDLIALTNALQGVPKAQALTQLQSVGIEKKTAYVYKMLSKIHESKGEGA